MKSRILAFTVMITGVAIGLSSPPGVAVFAVLLPLIALVLGPRFEMDRLAQAALTVAAMVLGVLIPRLGYGLQSESTALLGQQALNLGMPMLGVAVARSIVKRPAYGDPLTLTATLVALTAAGRANTGLLYPVLASAAVVAGLFALWAADDGRAPLRRVGSWHVAAVMLAAFLGLASAVVASQALPKLHDRFIGQIVARMQSTKTGFSDTMQLGALSGMLQSDEVVLRVRGGSPPLLRGIVLTEYSQGAWFKGLNTAPEVRETDRAPDEADIGRYVEIEHASTAKQHFVPLDASDVIVDAGVYKRDVFQLAHPTDASGFESKRVWFRNDGAGSPPLAPRPEDLALTKATRRELEALVRAWGVADKPPAERMRAIERRLQTDYSYSLDFERSDYSDPVLDFLKVHPEGHCEYFASAMALLGRAAGVPTRVIGGYRVTEESPFGYHIVRERNAHSWVEAYVDGHWVTFDPTPPSDLAAGSLRTTTTFAALFDGLRTTWEVIDDWLAKRSAFELSLLVVALVGVLILGRAIRNRRAEAKLASAADPPLPAYVELEAALAARGLVRPRDETLARFADRIEASDLDAALRAKAGRTVRLYADLRYGASGNEPEIQRDLLGSARAIAR